MKYFKKIVGEKVYLSPVNPDDYETYTKWLNNPNITKYLIHHNQMIDLFSEKAFLEKKASEEFMLAIVRMEDDTLLGNIGLHEIDYKNGCANLGIFIGEEENLSKGYGSEAIKLLVKYGFEELRLHNIKLTVYSHNPRAIRAYEKCGFKEFGRRHEALYRNGQYLDVIYMEIINRLEKNN